MRWWLMIAVLAPPDGAQQIQSWIADPNRRVCPGSFGRESGRKIALAGVVSKAEERVKAAVELATQEDDAVRPHRPLPSNMPEARRKLNRVVQEVLQIQ